MSANAIARAARRDADQLSIEIDRLRYAALMGDVVDAAEIRAEIEKLQRRLADDTEELVKLAESRAAKAAS
jgi:hypothetical protein